MLVNTSFNVRGEPIVCTPEDAYRCFMRTEMDVLVLENFIYCSKASSLSRNATIRGRRSSSLTSVTVVEEAKELRKFGFVVGAAFALIFGLFLPWLFSFGTPWWPFIVCAALVIPALVTPRLLRPVQHGWMKLAEPIGRFNTKLILGLVFYLVFTPVGAIRRLIADPLVLREGGSESYRKPSRQRSAQSMERPF